MLQILPIFVFALFSPEFLASSRLWKGRLTVRNVFVIVIVFLSCSLTFGQDNTAPQRRDLFANIAKAYEPYKNVSAVWSEKSSSESTVAYFRSQSRGRLLVKMIKDDSGKTMEGYGGENLYHEGSVYMNLRFSPDERGALGSDTSVVIYSFIDPPKDKGLDFIGSISPAPAIGIVAGIWVPDILDSLTPDSVKISEQGDLIRISGDSERFDLKVTFLIDPSMDYLVKQVDYTREFPKQHISSNVSLEGITLDDLPPQIVHSRYSLTSFQMTEGIWHPTEVTENVVYPPYVSRSLTEHDKNGKPLVLREEDGSIVIMPGSEATIRSTLENISFNFRFSDSGVPFRFSTEIPNGTSVIMQDAPHLAFAWIDGKIVPLTVEGLRALKGQKFLGGPTSPRFWMTLIGLLMIIVALSHKVYTILQRKGVIG